MLHVPSLRLRTVVLTVLFSATTSFISTVPADVPLPRPEALTPQPADALGCADTASFEGRLTASSGSTTAITRSTTGNVFAYVSKVTQEWSCTNVYRYDGLAWARDSDPDGNFDWGNLIHSTAVSCNYVLNSTDYIKANSTTDCPDTDAEYAMPIYLEHTLTNHELLETTFHNDTTPDEAGDFMFIHTDCTSYYSSGGGEQVRYNYSFAPTEVNNRPGANCDPLFDESTNTTQAIVVDGTAPTRSFDWPTAAGPTLVSSPSVSIQFDATDAVAGFDATHIWSLQREATSWNGTTCGSAWAQDGVATTGTDNKVDQVVSHGPLSGSSCYRWQLSATDANGNQATTVASGIVRVDPTGNLGQQPQHTVETWDLGAGDELGVNVVTGNLTAIHPVADLPIRGGRLPITLAYNSLDIADVGFGPGWRLDLQRRLTINADNSVTFIDATGARHLFGSPSTVGTITNYSIPATIDAKLVRDTSQNGQEFTLTYKDRSSDVFTTVGSSGLLRYIRDRLGAVNQVTVNYSGSTTDITTVVDPGGRSVSFSWNADTTHHVTQIVDWAVVDGGGIVLDSGTPNRATRFFYTGGVLQSWADPLNPTLSSCTPPAPSHLTCLTYAAGRLATIAKTQTYTTLVGSALSSSKRPATTIVTYRGSEVAAVRDGTQTGTTETAITRPSPSTVNVLRHGTPDLSLTYGLESFPDLYGRVATTTRAPGAGQVVAKTVWNGTYPTKVASTTEDFGGPLARAVSNTWSPGAIGPNLATTTEPLTASENRVTTNTYNGSDDLTRSVVASSLGGSGITTDTIFGTGCAPDPLDDLLVCSVVSNRVDGTKGNGAANVEDVTVDYEYDGSGQRTKETRWNYASGGSLLDSRATGWIYDANGNLASEIANRVDGAVSGGDDENPNATTNARTDLTTTYTYDTAGNRISAADPRRAIHALSASPGLDDYLTRWTFDALDQQRSEKTPTTPSVAITQKTASSTYDEFGAVRSATDFGDRVTASSFDAGGRLSATFEDVDGGGPTVAAQTGSVTVDTAGRTVLASDQRQLADPIGLGATKADYDVHGRVTTTTDAFGTAAASATDSAYDTLDRTTQVTVGAVQTTKTGYDPGGRAISVDDEFTCTTTTYDYRDLATQIVEGRTSGTPCAGTGTSTISQTFDGLGRLTAKTSGSDTLEASTFDAAGRATKTWSLIGSTYRYTDTTFNPLDEPTTEWRYTEVAGVQSGQTWARTNHDAAGNETDRCTWTALPIEWCKPAGGTYAGPQPVTWSSATFDARDKRVEQYTPGLGATTYDPNADYQVAGVYLPTAAGKEHQTVYAYDGRHRIDTISHVLCATSQRPCAGGNILSTTPANDYDHDVNDSRTKVTEDNGSGSTTRYYCHDARNQLVGVYSASGCSSGQLETYVYDLAGNRTLAAGRTLTYDSEGQLATCSVTACTPIFDTDGRLTSVVVSGGATWSYLYDAESRLVAACKSASCTGSGFARFDFTYDGEGHRIRIVETPASGSATTTDLRYNGDRVASEASTTGATTIIRTFTTDASGEILKMSIAGDPVLLHNGEYLVTWNGHGDALALLKVDPGTGTLTAANRYTYSTWGAPTTNTLNGYADLGFRYLYVGRLGVQWDNSVAVPAGLLYMQARHYSPEFGRFQQPDPSAAESNLYDYAANAPLSRIDPMGTRFELLSGGGGFGLGLARGTTKYIPRTSYNESKMFWQIQEALSGRGKTIAGAGARTPIRSISGVVSRFGGKPGEWAKRVGGMHSYGGAQYKYQLHWYENTRTGLKVDFKLVRYLDGRRINE